MMVKRIFLGLFLVITILFSSNILAIQSFGPYTYNILEQPTFNNNTAFVNSSRFWDTLSLGPLDDVNSSQFFSVNNKLNINFTFLTAGLFLRLDGANQPTANYNWVTNLSTTGSGSFTSGINVLDFEIKLLPFSDYALTNTQNSVQQRIRFIDGSAGFGAISFDFSNDSFSSFTRTMTVFQNGNVTILGNLIAENITTKDGGVLTSNVTCTFLFSPAATTAFEVCDV